MEAFEERLPSFTTHFRDLLIDHGKGRFYIRCPREFVIGDHRYVKGDAEVVFPQGFKRALEQELIARKDGSGDLTSIRRSIRDEI